jgi:hypothetical protein
MMLVRINTNPRNDAYGSRRRAPAGSLPGFHEKWRVPAISLVRATGFEPVTFGFAQLLLLPRQGQRLRGRIVAGLQVATGHFIPVELKSRGAAADDGDLAPVGDHSVEL